MTVGKKLLMGLLALLLAAAIGAGIRWNRENYVMVDFRFYPRNESALDLRGRKLSTAHFDKLTAKLPDCDILWDVPFRDTVYPSDAKTVDITALTAEDVPLLDYLTELETVNAQGCTDYEALLALEERRPELDIRYQVRLGDGEFHREAEEITLRGVTTMELSRLDNMRKLKSVICAGGETSAVVGLREACAQRGIDFCILAGGELFDTDTTEAVVENATGEDLCLLAGLPGLETLHLVTPTATAQELLSMKDNNPQIQITWEVEIFGALCSSGEEELDLSEADITELSQIDAAMAWFPETERVFLGKSAVDNETLAAWREEVRDQYKLVWTVSLGDKLTARTDDTTFMPVREHVYYFNDEEAYNLRYCEDMICVDIGHMSIHNIDFVEYMPNLTYLILAHTQLQYIEPISTCKNLKFLELDWSPIRDLSPLVGCTALEDLNLGNIYCSFEPIKKMTWLKNVWVIGCTGGTAYKLSQALPDTKVQGSGTATVDSGWRDLPNYYDMRDVLGMYYMSW